MPSVVENALCWASVRQYSVMCVAVCCRDTHQLCTSVVNWALCVSVMTPQWKKVHFLDKVNIVLEKIRTHYYGRNVCRFLGFFSLALLGKLATVWKMRTDKTLSPPLSLTHSFTFIFFLSHAQPHKYRSAITVQRLGITSKDPFLIEKHIYYCLMEQYID